ncbi:MAG: serine/threonine protein kinase [Rubrivivax sp.]|nr:serine/threonine protein kinase [Rubrivivax sp.]
MPPPISDPQRLRRLNALLEEALALPQAERGPWLAGRAEDERTFVPELARLLARAAVETDTFMRQPAAAALDELAAAQQPDAAGDLIGPWRLLQPLGEGGMATVWRAERADGSLAREVALKLPRLGWSAGLVQRMARERDLLAALEHPHIARLYDAGVTEGGRPWLAMERVAGLPIDDHCRRHGLEPDAVLQLALQVCDALAHAHARLIVHRDLKPANILVTEQGEVRLLDFGVGKLLQEDGTPASHLTQVLGNALTPDYASPEQIAGKPVTVATDVYSLGVVLYELLSGQRPYRLGRQSTAALEEAILAADVPRASARATDRARARALRGDLDAVLAKALAKNPARRYTSVESLAADLRAHLEGRPITAQAPSWRYRGAKFLRRNRLVLAVSGAATLALLASLATTLVQAQRAQEQAAIASRERDRAFEQLRFAQAADEQLRLALSEATGRAMTARELAERTEQLVLKRFANEPVLRARLLDQLGGLYLEAGALEDAQRVTVQAHEAAVLSGHARVVGQVECQRAALAAVIGRPDEARRLLHSARAELAPATEDNARERLDCHVRATQIHLHLDDLDRTRAEAEAGLKLAATLPHVSDPSAQILQSSLAHVLGRRGEFAAAIDIFRRLLAQHAMMGMEGSTAEEVTTHDLAYLLSKSGQPLAGWQLFERLRAREAAAHRAPDPIALSAYAQTLNRLGRHQEAAALARQAHTLARELRSPRGEARTLLLLAWAACRADVRLPCEPTLDQAERAMRALGTRAGPALPHQLRAERALAAQRPADAKRHLQAALTAAASSGDRDSLDVQLQMLAARIELRLGQTAAAMVHADAALADARRLAQGLPFADYLGQALATHAEVLLAQGQVEAARLALVDALVQLDGAAGPQAPASRQTRAVLAEASARLKAAEGHEVPAPPPTGTALELGSRARPP